ncbi:putative membrane protein [Kadiweu virus]|uniref:Membrane protein n=1 Tax=Kadiweu virus TaxID=1795438 RepID=A0A1B1X3Z9_9NIDO|nr:putative membrane protein [Kadiweu virus]ANW72258.2 putative membrane protein [Kadiweu virus]
MKSAIFYILSISLLAFSNADEAPAPQATTKLCESNASQHCTSMGYSYCKSVSGVQSCYCPHQQNYTSVVDVIDKDQKCSITSSKYLDPHYWFRDLLAASVTLLVLFTLVTWAYLIPTYAKIDAMYDQKAQKTPLHYIPLLPRSTNGGYSILPTGRYR